MIVKGYKIIKEIIPSQASQKGGGYLDLAVTHKNKIIAIYEVKTQDFIFGKDFYPNPALVYIWKNNPTQFKDSMNNKFIANKRTIFNFKCIIYIIMKIQNIIKFNIIL